MSSDEVKPNQEAAAAETAQPQREHVDADPSIYTDRPSGWMYRSIRIFGTETWYASPKVQLLMISLVCFLCPGMYNSLTGLGGAGQVNRDAQNKASIALYSTFAVVGFFAGTFANRLGLRLTVGVGGLGYCIYAASFLCYNHTQNEGFVIFAGAFLGVCAGLLWCAQGAIMMSYPSEESKGRYISWFWIIFNLGAVIGALIPLAQLVNQKKQAPANDGTYIAFIVLMVLGAGLSALLCNANAVIREDNTKVILMKNPTFVSEFVGLWETLISDPWIVLLFPMFFSSNIFYTYQNNAMNAAHFNPRTRALNNLLYWLAQIFGAVVNGYALDIQGVRRSVRARVSFIVLFALTFLIWGLGWYWQEQQVSRAYIETEGSGWSEDMLVDWTDGGKKFIGPMFLYFFYGFYDAIWQTDVYWYMGSLSNSGRKAANLAGFYKGLQSGAAAIFWSMDERHLDFNTIFGATWGCLGGSLLFAAPLIWWRIKDHVSIEEDLKFSDETIEDVIAGPKEKKLEGEA